MSLRASLHAKLNLVAQVGADGGIVSAQWAALRAGAAVTFTTAQLKSWYPRGTEHPSLPPDLDVASAWTLAGDETLAPAE
jgi:hypothetical protein